MDRFRREVCPPMSAPSDEQRLKEKLLQATQELEERQAQLIQAEKLASAGADGGGHRARGQQPGWLRDEQPEHARTLRLGALLPLLHFQRELLSRRGPGRQTQPGGAAHPHARAVAGGGRGLHPGGRARARAGVAGGAQRIKEIVQSLRTFAREDSGEPQLVDLNTELESTLKHRVERAEVQVRGEPRLRAAAPHPLPPHAARPGVHQPAA